MKYLIKFTSLLFCPWCRCMSSFFFSLSFLKLKTIVRYYALLCTSLFFLLSLCNSWFIFLSYLIIVFLFFYCFFLIFYLFLFISMFIFSIIFYLSLFVFIFLFSFHICTSLFFLRYFFFFFIIFYLSLCIFLFIFLLSFLMYFFVFLSLILIFLWFNGRKPSRNYPLVYHVGFYGRSKRCSLVNCYYICPTHRSVTIKLHGSQYMGPVIHEMHSWL